ncbi:relative of glutathione S-transferase [Salinisphaera dokdonensis CL-ES53]|uniref:Relative of glutathione S-transferase n=1 Tax=Salinisphaera dokdonensis CL-ES53 TaxID=1304272 RepID=A0ABV2AXZ9_9GAMM
MPVASVTPFYAALLALLFFALSVRTLRVRRGLQIAVGDAGNAQMLRAMRVHSNFAEYVPISLLLIFMFEAAGGWALMVHLLGLSLLLGRLLHAYGVSRTPEDYRFRIVGMSLTFTAFSRTGTRAARSLRWAIARLIIHRSSRVAVRH